MTNESDKGNGAEKKKSQKELREVLKSVRQGSEDKKVLNSQDKKMVVNFQTKFPRKK